MNKHRIDALDLYSVNEDVFDASVSAKVRSQNNDMMRVNEQKLILIEMLS